MGLKGSDEMDGVHPAKLVIVSDGSKIDHPLVIIIEQQGTKRKRGYCAVYKNSGFRNGSWPQDTDWRSQSTTGIRQMTSSNWRLSWVSPITRRFCLTHVNTAFFMSNYYVDMQDGLLEVVQASTKTLNGCLKQCSRTGIITWTPRPTGNFARRSLIFRDNRFQDTYFKDTGGGTIGTRSWKESRELLGDHR